MFQLNKIVQIKVRQCFKKIILELFQHQLLTSTIYFLNIIK